MAVLVAGTVAAMSLTQRLRQEGPIVSDIRLKTKPEESGQRYRACFRTPREDDFEVAMVNEAQEVVRVLAGDARLREGRPYCFDWDGTGDDREPVPAGVYRLRLSLSSADRVAVSGEKLTIAMEQP
ncbi:MAG: hypothetical protein M3O25_08430 [Actinomycetota bacterium]|nr:hypothetical protein [Actinomycetota bacterium]